MGSCSRCPSWAGSPPTPPTSRCAGSTCSTCPTWWRRTAISPGSPGSCTTSAPGACCSWYACTSPPRSGMSSRATTACCAACCRSGCCHGRKDEDSTADVALRGAGPLVVLVGFGLRRLLEAGALGQEPDFHGAARRRTLPGGVQALYRAALPRRQGSRQGQAPGGLGPGLGGHRPG